MGNLKPSIRFVNTEIQKKVKKNNPSKDYIVGVYAGVPINTIANTVAINHAATNATRRAKPRIIKMPRIITISIGPRWGVIT